MNASPLLQTIGNIYLAIAGRIEDTFDPAWKAPGE